MPSSQPSLHGSAQNNTCAGDAGGEPMPVALTIAGSDPSGGAGIQADIKTFTIIGVYCGAVITALTAQNTMGVSTFLPLSPSFVRQQAEEVLSDLNVTHIKIGMVGDADIAETLGALLQNFAGKVIYDPVFKSSDGNSLYSAGHIAATSEAIIRQATVITPNISELELLAGQSCPDTETALAAAQKLLFSYANLEAVCVKGGHLDEEKNIVIDYLLLKSHAGTADGKNKQNVRILQESHARIATSNSHGTGCTFASAFTAFHLLSSDWEIAFSKATQLMEKLLRQSASYRIGHGTGPLLHHLWQKNKPQ